MNLEHEKLFDTTLEDFFYKLNVFSGKLGSINTLLRILSN